MQSKNRANKAVLTMPEQKGGNSAIRALGDYQCLKHLGPMMDKLHKMPKVDAFEIMHRY